MLEVYEDDFRKKLNAVLGREGGNAKRSFTVLPNLLLYPSRFANGM